MLPARARVLFLLSPLLAAVSAQSNKVCYGSTGNQDPNLGVCDPSASVSSCCPFGQICYSNGLCQRPGVTSVNSTVYTIYGVHGCTRNGGSTGECLVVDKCLAKGVGVTVCGANTYCCYGLKSCDCKNDTQVFTLPAGTILTTLPASTSSAASSTKSVTTSPTTGTAGQITTSATESSSPTAEPSSSNTNNSVAVGAGVGVGVGVFLILLAGLAFFFWRRRHRQKKELAASTISHPDMASPSTGYAADTKYGPSAVYAPVAQHNPDGPESYNHIQPSELDSTRNPSELPAGEVQASRLPVQSSEVKPARYS